MYHCMITGKQSRPGEGCNKITVATKPRIYTRWVKNEETLKWEEVECGHGWEIVRQINASDEGVKLWESWSPEEREAFLKRLDS
jgi:hypothetical protein